MNGENPLKPKIDDQQKVLVKIQPTVFSAGMKTEEYALLPLGENGLLQTSLPIHLPTDSLTVILEWKGARGTTIQLSQTVTNWELTPAPIDTLQ